MNLRLTEQQWHNPVIAKITNSGKAYDDIYNLGRMALVDWDNLKLIIDIVKSRGAFQHGFLTYSRPISILMLAFQLLASGLEKTIKIILISIEAFDLENHKNHNLRSLFELLPDKVAQNPDFADNYAIFIKPRFENMGIGTKKKFEDLLDLDSVHLRYESGKHVFEIEVSISDIELIHHQLTNLIMELLNLADHTTKKNSTPNQIASCLKNQKPIVTFLQAQSSKGNILTGIKDIERICISTKEKRFS